MHVTYENLPLQVNSDLIYKDCAIHMPTDKKRNIMNASSNFEIISKIIKAIRDSKRELFHSPGVFGNLGGYPVYVDFRNESNRGNHVEINEDYFPFDEMVRNNRLSIAMDGIEDVKDGYLIYTDALVANVKSCFHVDLPKRVHISDSQEIGSFLIKEIILPRMAER